jgi:hypothetical protein
MKTLPTTPRPDATFAGLEVPTTVFGAQAAEAFSHPHLHLQTLNLLANTSAIRSLHLLQRLPLAVWTSGGAL